MEKGADVTPGRKQLIYSVCYGKGEFGDEEKINGDENTNHHICCA